MALSTWLPLEDLAEQLYCSERTIYKLKASNVFEAGTCFYRIGNGQEKGKCIYNLEKCREALLLHTKEGQEKKKGTRYSKKMLKELVSRKKLEEIFNIEEQISLKKKLIFSYLTHPSLVQVPYP